MSSLADLSINFKPFCKVDFSGGDLSSDCGLLLIGQFMNSMGITSFIKENFGADTSKRSKHSDADILMQLLYQNMAGYTTDDTADHLAHDPVMKTLLHKDRLASQPTVSRFRHRLGHVSQIELNSVLEFLRRQAYRVQRPKDVVLDVDTTILRTYGKQSGAEYVYHYGKDGFHPMLCYDGNTGDLLKAELRDGSMYCGNGAADFIRPLLEEYRENCPGVSVLVRGDSGFAMPDLYECVEAFSNARYVIRLKSNSVLQEHVQEEASAFMDEHSGKPGIPAPRYGEFSYAARSWGRERRVVYKIELRCSEGSLELLPTCTFIVTNRNDAPDRIVKLYQERGNMENFIKESKNEFNFESMCSREKIVNENRLAVSAIAYGIFNLFRRLSLQGKWKSFRASEVRQRLLHIAGRYVSHAKEKILRLCSTYPYKMQFSCVHHQIDDLDGIVSS